MRRGTALVTGASSGLGLRTAVMLARRGFRVFATMRDPARAAPLRAALAAAHQQAEVVRLDVTDPDSITAAVQHILQVAGAVDVLVNNAGAMLTGCVEDIAPDELSAQFEVHVLGPHRLIRACLPTMRARSQGWIINVSSISARHPAPGHGAYCAAKAALEGLSASLRHELAPLGIWVSLVEPGMFPTDIFSRNHHTARAAQEPASPYRGLLETLERLRADTQHHLLGADPDAPARVIARIATSPRPRLRYPVGTDAWLATLAGPLLSDGWARLLREARP